MAHIRAAVAGMKRDIERWEKDLAAAEKGGHSAIAEKIRGWIAEVGKLIDDAGY